MCCNLRVDTGRGDIKQAITHYKKAVTRYKTSSNTLQNKQ